MTKYTNRALTKPMIKQEILQRLNETNRPEDCFDVSTDDTKELIQDETNQDDMKPMKAARLELATYGLKDCRSCCISVYVYNRYKIRKIEVLPRVIKILGERGKLVVEEV